MTYTPLCSLSHQVAPPPSLLAAQLGAHPFQVGSIQLVTRIGGRSLWWAINEVWWAVTQVISTCSGGLLTTYSTMASSTKRQFFHELGTQTQNVDFTRTGIMCTLLLQLHPSFYSITFFDHNRRSWRIATPYQVFTGLLNTVVRIGLLPPPTHPHKKLN